MLLYSLDILSWLREPQLSKYQRAGTIFLTEECHKLFRALTDSIHTSRKPPANLKNEVVLGSVPWMLCMCRREAVS